MEPTGLRPGPHCGGCWEDPLKGTDGCRYVCMGGSLCCMNRPTHATDVAAQRQQFQGRPEPTPAKGVADTAGGGVKADTGKPPVSLIPRSAALAEAEVLDFGAKKYAAHNWRKGMKWSRLVDAMLRHALAYADGEDLDPETGLSHLAHLRCCAGFLIEYAERGLGEDDRFKAEVA